MSDKNIYRVVIVEPSPILQKGLSQMVEQSGTYLVVALLPNLYRIEEKMATLRADIVVLNPMVIEYSRRVSIKSLFPVQSIIALIYSYIDKDILRQFHGVIEINNSQLDINRLLNETISQSESRVDSILDVRELTDREQEILIAVAKGMMNKEIAALHNISIHTVISHRKNISRKTGIKSASGLAVYALLNNLIEQDEIH